ncbi:hypothetical protein MEO40_06980 [Dolichospermum sp. ST_sed1]|nr:hypothetical protein [Dolichospermum sp. ST_sed1]
MSKKALLLLLGVNYLSSCGSPQDSQVKSVSLTGIAGNNDRLIWLEDRVIYSGKCTAGTLANRTNCKTDVNSLAESEAVNMVTDSMNELIANQESEIVQARERRLQNHPIVLAIKKNITFNETNVANSKATLGGVIIVKNETEAKVQDAIRLVQDYDMQIAAVNNELVTNPRDPNLLALRSKLLNERPAAWTAYTKLDAELDKIVDRFNKLNADINQFELKIQAYKNDLTRELNTLEVDVSSEQRELANLQKIKTQIPTVLQKLSEPVLNYRIELLSDNEKMLLKFIDVAVNKMDSAVLNQKFFIHLVCDYYSRSSNPFGSSTSYEYSAGLEVTPLRSNHFEAIGVGSVRKPYPFDYRPVKMTFNNLNIAEYKDGGSYATLSLKPHKISISNGYSGSYTTENCTGSKAL